MKTFLFLIGYCLFSLAIVGQLPTTLRDYTVLAGPNGTGATIVGSSININGGAVGAYNLIQTTGNVAFNNASMHSGDKIILTNSNIVSGKITAANSSGSTGTVLQVGSSALITGNIDVNGNVVIGGGSVNGIVTIPAGRTYSGPTPSGGVSFGPPVLPVLPAMPAATSLPTQPQNLPNITTTQTVTPNNFYGNVNFGGNKTLTLDGPGIYYFSSFHWSGNSNKLVLNFKNQTGNFIIYVYSDADFGKLNASITNGGNASRIYLETQGTGSTSSLAGNSFVIANGSSGGGSKWNGTVYAPSGGINIGSGTGSSALTGTFVSAQSVMIQSGVSVNYAPYTVCNEPGVVAGTDRPLAFTTMDSLIATSSNPSATFSWQAINGGTIVSGANNAKVFISTAGTYIVTASTATDCFSKDTVVISARVPNIIGAELLSIYENRTSPNLSSSPFFAIQNGYVLVDVIVNTGYYNSVLTLLQTSPYGLIPPYGLNYFPNGQSNFIITGLYPIANLLKLNLLSIQINYVRTHYAAFSNAGIKNSAGDTTIRTHLVRSGYNINGNGIKVCIISDSYATITNGTTNPPDQFNTQTAAQDVAQGDLPGTTNPFGFTKPVRVLQDFPLRRSDEGRAMAQIIHDVAPGAQLYFRTGFFTNTDFAKGIKELRDSGCHIIVDDMTYMNEPFLKDGVVAKTVDTVVSQGVTYFSAAGNFDHQSYEKDYNGADATAIGFPGKTAHNFAAGDAFQQIKLRPGNYVFVLQWFDGIHSTGESGTQFDLDFYLTPNTNGAGLIGFNRDNTMGDPIEFIPIKIVGTSETDTTSKVYNILIINNSTGSPSRVKYICFKRDAAANIQFMEHVEGTSTVVGQANALGAIAVGAARFDKAPPFMSPPQIESFSSSGGTKTNGVVRQKPDIVAPDGVNTTVALGPDYPNTALDGFSNFFGTSAAAPHAAAAAALLMEGRKKFLNQNVVSPAEVKSLLVNSATDMETPGFDYISGHGLINIDISMRTFAAPTPHLDLLIVPNGIIPGEQTFTVTVQGNNFRPNSVLYFEDSALASTIILDTVNGLATAIIPAFEGNPDIRMYTPPYPTTNGLDGGFSNIKRFFDAEVVVQALNATKKYGDALPSFQAQITINGTALEDTTLTLAQLGLANMVFTTTAGTTTDVGTVFIAPQPVQSELKQNFGYVFLNGLLSITKKPVKVTPNDLTVMYGQAINNITYKYQDENGALITDPFLLQKLDSSHHHFMPDNVLAVVNGFASSGLTTNDLQNMSGMSSFQAIKNSRKFQTINGEWEPAPDPSGFDVQYLVDVSALSIKNFRTPSLLDDTLVAAYPNVNSRAMVRASALMNGTAQSGITANLVQLVNGQLVPIINSAGGGLVPIINGQLVQLVNGVTLQLVNGQLVPIVNGQLVQLVNGQWMQTVNGQLVPLVNAQLVQIVNGQLVQLVNGQLVPLVNGQLVQLVNGSTGNILQMLNGQLVQLVNGQLVPLVNGALVQIVNGQLVQLVNGQLVPLVNGQLVQLVNGELVQLVNGALVQLVNNAVLPITNGLVQIVNGQLVQLVNGQLVPLINGQLVQLVNGQLVPLVNSYTAAPGNNENAAVIIDADDVNLQDGFIGGMFSTNIITGLDIGEQKLISGTVVNGNFDFTYGLGTATITSDPCLQTHSPFKNFGNTTQQPTSLWLNVVTKVSGQLTAHGDYLLFKNGDVTLNFINSTPVISNYPIPDGKIVADNLVPAPITHFDAATNTWITKVPVGFASTSDLFVTGGIINSSTGFQKSNGNTNSVVRGKFLTNKVFSDQWAYGIAAYQPQFTYEMIGAPGDVVSINGSYRAATPLPILQYLVQGGSGGGGNNYTGSNSSFQAVTACVEENAGQRSMITATSEEQSLPLQPEMMVHPNPARDFLNLVFVPSRTGINKLEIYTINGAKVFETDYGLCEAGKRYSKTINIGKLVNGIYLVRLSGDSNAFSKKIVITR